MVTLQQIEPRTPISSAPFNIKALGSYYLTGNITVTSGDAIDINASGVTLDLNGFTISSTADPAAGTAISINGSVHNIQILNGTISGSSTYNGGNYGNSGFLDGIYCESETNGGIEINVRVTGVSVFGCLDDGINLGTGLGSIVESCSVSTVGGNGIVADIVANSWAMVCGDNGIYATTANNCVGGATSSGTGLYAGNTAENCSGSSQDGDGLFAASTAMNCNGSSTSGTGLDANNNAENCSGSSQDGAGLFAASTAMNCNGSSTSGTGLDANFNAENCCGSSFSGAGLQAFTAFMCFGTSQQGTGLAANFANFCIGYGSPTVSVPPGQSFNMPP
jgi:hypothetical protein